MHHSSNRTNNSSHIHKKFILRYIIKISVGIRSAQMAVLTITGSCN